MLGANADRVRQGAITEDAAERDLLRLLEGATVRPDPPPGLTGDEPQADAWLWLNDDGSLVCPMVRKPSGLLVAMSVFARGQLSDAARRRRTGIRRYDRESKRMPKRTRRDSRPQQQPDPEEWTA